MISRRVVTFGVVALVAAAGAARVHAEQAAQGKTGAHFEWTTKSAEAKTGLAELQQRIENFQFGPANVERRAEDRRGRPAVRAREPTTSRR